MSLIQKLREKWARRRQLKTVGVLHDEAAPAPAAPVIETKWGSVTESARRGAAENMRTDPEKRRAVESLLARQLYRGDLELGVAESRRRYPEAYQDDQDNTKTKTETTP
jgi:hypothetical protein